ncbi:Flp pilus assembly protein ATPase CpaE-like protein [Arthrobacter sp. FB24]|uniref:AAA family ATPase n=1 Tax=Arthrobacter sp. (strain FB24) TaxID=290399 RepID=UPI0000527AFD|nr:AAA family ATPase [Arthrobacter sp. FB24]ABK04311.1 Flp pilus assembly protein ATPase CpaE-like protein [Arthrobacter sp. FB24]
MSRFVLITPDVSFDGRLRQAVAGGLQGGVQTFFTSLLPADPNDLFAHLDQERPEVLILGPDVPVEEALRLATVMNVRFPELSVILASEPDPDFILQAMRAGIRDILSPDSDAAQIRVLLERASQQFAGRYRVQAAAPMTDTNKGLVIGVFSPKGGVGKTTIATNIAVGLGKIAPMSVVIVDLDLQFGDVASALYLDPQHTVTDAVSPAASQDSLVLKAFLTVHPASIYAVCAPPTPVDADEITPEQVSRLLEQLSEQFQYVVVDTAPGLPEIGLAAMEQCTDVVWVSGMDIPSVRGLRSGLDVLRQLDILPETRHVVLNMADSKLGLTVQDLESTIGAPVDVSIPRSRAVALSTNRGIPVLQESAKDPATKGLNQLVNRFNPAWRATSQRKLHRRVVV